MIKRETENIVRVCCGKKGCPTVEKLDEDSYKVTDDDGNTIIVKKEDSDGGSRDYQLFCIYFLV